MPASSSPSDHPLIVWSQSSLHHQPTHSSCSKHSNAHLPTFHRSRAANRRLDTHDVVMLRYRIVAKIVASEAWRVADMIVALDQLEPRAPGAWSRFGGLVPDFRLNPLRDNVTRSLRCCFATSLLSFSLLLRCVVYLVYLLLRKPAGNPSHPVDDPAKARGRLRLHGSF